MPLNVEIKARCPDPDHVRYLLSELGAEYQGRDHQVDHYYRVPQGRLKLRIGNIENNLIYYQRDDLQGPKSSQFLLHPVQESDSLHQLLATALGLKITVDKQRYIYFIGNVKFHVDEVKGLGSFVEIEASDLYEPFTADELEQQCQHYMQALKISQAALIDVSYSDLLIQQSIAHD